MLRGAHLSVKIPFIRGFSRRKYASSHRICAHSKNNKVKFRKKENKVLPHESGWIIKLIKRKLVDMMIITNGRSGS